MEELVNPELTLYKFDWTLDATIVKKTIFEKLNPQNPNFLRKSEAPK